MNSGAGADTYIYDERGRLTRETKANGQIIEYGYDKAGNRKSVTIYAEDGIEITTEAHYSYDALNRIDHVWDGPKGDNRRTDYTYDEVGNLATVHYPNNTNTTYTYDDLNRLISVKQVTMADPVDRIVEYVYTLGPTGNREQVEEYQYYSSMENPYENGPYRKVKYKYDKLYRLTGETVLDYTGSIERSVTYEYDKVGNRLSMKVANADGHLEVTYTYNERDQLTTETRVFDQVSEVTFKPDGSYYVHAPPTPSVWSGRLLLSFASLTLTCLLAPFVLLKTNRAGKRAGRNRRFIAAISAFMTPMFVITPDALAYLHNDAMWYSAVASGAVGLPGPTTTTVTYTYDNSGNLISKAEDNGLATSTIDYTYDAENHLIQVDPNNGPHTIISYTYDADGIRLSKTKSGETTYFTTDKNRPYVQVLEERNQDGNLLTQYTYGHDLISQASKPGDPEESIRYYHYDGQMSTRLITEGTENTAFTGWITDEITYDAFGQITDREDYGNPTNTKYLYTGEQYDSDLGQYYLRARYYEQSVGRFTTRDSFDGFANEPISLHKYLYANANPVMMRDPAGMFSLGELNITSFVQATLFTINLAGFIHHANKAMRYVMSAIACLADDLPIDAGLYLFAAVLHAGFACLNMIGLKAGLIPPPPSGLAGGLSAACGSGTIALIWTKVMVNPAFLAWIMTQLVPALATLAYFAKEGHEAQWQHRASNGRIKTRGTETSGGTGKSRPTPTEQLQSHTEQKILKKLEDKVKPGDIVTIQGTRPPCKPGHPNSPWGTGQGCHPQMHDFAVEYNVKIIYSWADEFCAYPCGPVVGGP